MTIAIFCAVLAVVLVAAYVNAAKRYRAVTELTFTHHSPNRRESS